MAITIFRLVQFLNGFVGRSDTDDWFNFQVPSNGGVRITLLALLFFAMLIV